MKKAPLNASLILGGLAAAAAILGQRPLAAGPGSHPETPATPIATTMQIGSITSSTEPLIEPASEFPPGPDTTGLLQESLSVDELLDVAADSGEEFSPDDRDRLAALLRADPQLRQSMAD